MPLSYPSITPLISMDVKTCHWLKLQLLSLLINTFVPLTVSRNKPTTSNQLKAVQGIRFTTGFFLLTRHGSYLLSQSVLIHLGLDLPLMLCVSTSIICSLQYAKKSKPGTSPGKITVVKYAGNMSEAEAMGQCNNSILLLRVSYWW